MTTELNEEDLDCVSGGDKAKENALVGLYKQIERLELAVIDVEPAGPSVPMKL